MRISDWSSDVCSSDLTLDWLERAIARAPGRPFNILDAGSGYGDMLRAIHRWAARHGVEVRLTGIDLNRSSADAALKATPAGAGIDSVTGEIGRASCRDRVGQSVYISVVAVSLKQKKSQSINYRER